MTRLEEFEWRLEHLLQEYGDLKSSDLVKLFGQLQARYE